ncbi:MAG: hypothetical protein AAB923_03750, partial [Patescibacteria group bacterium]
MSFTSLLAADETPHSLEDKGVLVIDIGGGPFDHHASREKTTASALVAGELGVLEIPALQKLLAYAKRDDFFGKGTISTDALDRAFGLSGLVVNLNKRFPDDPGKVFSLVAPLIEAHYVEEMRRTEELPREFEAKMSAGEVETDTIRQGDKNLKAVILSSDNVSLPGYLRSQQGGRFDIVLQWLSSGHANILTRPTKRPDLRGLVRTIRMKEIEIRGEKLPDDLPSLEKPGRIEK